MKRSLKNKFYLLSFLLTAIIALLSQFNILDSSISNTLSSTLSSTFSSTSSSSAPHNFTEAKKILRTLFSDNPKTFYCGCAYNKNGQIDLASCGYQTKGDKLRATRIEWEHIIPVSEMAHHFDCWRKPLCTENGVRFKGRRCCQKINPDFAKMEANLHNLVPEIGELNKIRSNYRFSMLPHIPKGQLGSCEFKVDPKERRVEPRESVRGMIARTYLYLSERYHLRLSGSQQKLFHSWNKLYPPTEWEYQKDKRISEIQGDSNPYISNYANYAKIINDGSNLSD